MKKKFKLIVVLIFLVFFSFNFIRFGLNMYEEYMQIDFEAEISNIEKYENIDEAFIINYKNQMLLFYIFLTFILSFIASLIEPALIWIILLAIYLSRNKYYKLKLSKIDFLKEKIYYRDILKEYSASVLAYLDGFEFNYPNVLIGVLLELENKKIININENSITVINSNEELNESSKYILNSIKDNKLTINKSEYEKLVIKDSIDRDLLKEGLLIKKTLIKEILVSFIFYILFNLSFIIFIFNMNKIDFNNNIFLVLIVFLVLFIIMLFLIYYPITKIISLIILLKKLKINNYVRTIKGEEVNIKIEGLKFFLKDFSLLDEKNKEEIVIWEEYLIYSVIFNQNIKIVDKYKNLVNIDI